MKTIHLLRHAKSSWDDPLLADIDRPLNKRGLSNAPLMAKALIKDGCEFNNVYCSPANRAQTTIQLIDKHTPNSSLKWHTDPDLYTFNNDYLIHWLAKRADDMKELMIVGHNPALTDLVNRLSSSRLDNIPTCGYVRLQCENDFEWCEINDQIFQVVTFITPKTLKK